jgi:hypothetical protein
MADLTLGKTVRCLACHALFLARPDPAPRPLPAAPATAVRIEDEGPSGSSLPFCPGCGKRVSWDVLRCPFCLEELEPELPPQVSQPPPARRDWLRHRGPLLLTWGNVSLAFGAAALCTIGVAAVIGVPLGIAVWAVAQRDLQEMQAGRMDPDGQRSTENARTSGMIGTLLGLLFGGIYALFYLGQY